VGTTEGNAVGWKVGNDVGRSVGAAVGDNVVPHSRIGSQGTTNS